MKRLHIHLPIFLILSLFSCRREDPEVQQKRAKRQLAADGLGHLEETVRKLGNPELAPHALTYFTISKSIDCATVRYFSLASLSVTTICMAYSPGVMFDPSCSCPADITLVPSAVFSG